MAAMLQNHAKIATLSRGSSRFKNTSSVFHCPYSLDTFQTLTKHENLKIEKK